MNLKRVLYTIIAMILICLCLPVSTLAETRNIYIGDIINLEISSQKISEEEITQKFKDFEIIELKKESGGYLLSIRTFEPGEYSINIGDKELVISVVSTLSDFQRDDIYEAEAAILEAGFIFHWRVLFYVVTGVFVVSGIYVLVGAIKKRKAKRESSYQLFLRRSSALSDKDDNYFVDLTFTFKEYVESVCNCRIIGKTTSEILNELKYKNILQDTLPDIQKWMTECDVYKFTQTIISDDKKHHHYEQLLNIVKRIEEKYNEKNEGAA